MAEANGADNALSCSQAQGFYFARPMPAAELVALLDDTLPVAALI